MRPIHTEPSGVRVVEYRNAAGETIPAYAAIQLLTPNTTNGRVIWDAQQWDGGDPADIIFINGPINVADGDYGQAYQPITPQWVLYNDEETPAFQEEWGVEADTYKIHSEGTGFIILGGATDGRVLAVAPTGGGCVSRNEVWHLIITGSPTGGSWDLDLTVLGDTDTLTFDYDFTAAEVKTELATHTNITSSDVATSGGDFPDAAIVIEFIGDLADSSIPPPMIDFSSLTGGSGVGVFVVRYQPGYPKDGS